MSSTDKQGSSLGSFPTSPPLYPHFNRPSGFWPCVKSCLVGGSNKYMSYNTNWPGDWEEIYGQTRFLGLPIVVTLQAEQIYTLESYQIMSAKSFTLSFMLCDQSSDRKVRKMVKIEVNEREISQQDNDTWEVYWYVDTLILIRFFYSVDCFPYVLWCIIFPRDTIRSYCYKLVTLCIFLNNISFYFRGFKLLLVIDVLKC